jgi:hypothetical protein
VILETGTIERYVLNAFGNSTLSDSLTYSGSSICVTGVFQIFTDGFLYCGSRGQNFGTVGCNNLRIS